jgi:uncharacterized protein (TIGR00661 family)
MNHPKKEKNIGKPRILVGPLDWGLGHATRCIPVVRELLVQGCEVFLAAEGRQSDLLQTEFPQITVLPLKGYNIEYAKSALGLFRNIIVQIPKILQSIRFENKWLNKIADDFQFDAIISDNRYGLYHPGICSIFITHQLTIKSPIGKWTEKIIQKLNYKYINRFSECWIPDNEGPENLAGELSHPITKPGIPVYYIGPLSRFTNNTTADKTLAIKENHLLIVLSGPEPQRSILENKIIREISNYNGTATVVRGLPGNQTLIPSTNMIKFYNHLSSVDLYHEMKKAEFVVSRSGYSTIMDIIALQKKSILIPTPGQTEQEYLADYCIKKQVALCFKQQLFSLEKALQQAKQFDYMFAVDSSGTNLKKAIHSLLEKI